MTKSDTDQHWNARAVAVENDAEVNIMDVFQRDLEYEEIERFLAPEMRLLEVGCGNGFSTARFRRLVRHVDAFDSSVEMITRARARFGEINNRFIHDNLLDPRSLNGPYDAVVCVRVLINLRDLDEQRRALGCLRALVKPHGLLVLAEGYRDGFVELSRLRAQVGLTPLEAAPINFYCRLDDVQAELRSTFDQVADFHLGAYDYLTRVLYPLVVGHDKVVHNSVFSQKCYELARAFNPEAFRRFSRMRGLVLRKGG